MSGGKVERLTAVVGYNKTTNGESYPVTREFVSASDHEAALASAIKERDDAYARVAWQPIETAPKDDFVLIAYPNPTNHDKTVVGEGMFRKGRWIWVGSEKHTMRPTHWMPLPLAPELAKEPS